MAKFKKGDKKPENSGRKKGTPNKLSLGVDEKLKEKGIDCIEEMLKIANETENMDLRFAVYKELIKYVYPQRKAVEMSGDISLPTVNIKGL